MCTVFGAKATHVTGANDWLKGGWRGAESGDPLDGIRSIRGESRSSSDSVTQSLLLPCLSSRKWVQGSPTNVLVQTLPCLLPMAGKRHGRFIPGHPRGPEKPQRLGEKLP